MPAAVSVFPAGPRTDPEFEALIVLMAQENRTWGCDHIQSAMTKPWPYLVGGRPLPTFLSGPEMIYTPPIRTNLAGTGWKKKCESVRRDKEEEDLEAQKSAAILSSQHIKGQSYW